MKYDKKGNLITMDTRDALNIAQQLLECASHNSSGSDSHLRITVENDKGTKKSFTFIVEKCPENIDIKTAVKSGPCFGNELAIHFIKIKEDQSQCDSCDYAKEYEVNQDNKDQDPGDQPVLRICHGCERANHRYLLTKDECDRCDSILKHK